MDSKRPLLRSDRPEGVLTLGALSQSPQPGLAALPGTHAQSLVPDGGLKSKNLLAEGGVLTLRLLTFLFQSTE